ncbi:MAG TPA: VOC family protein [Egibacteraceae bacterium]|nr:VOC family protein [Egibacteraceae bacterium]
MEQRVSLVTLGVADVDRARAFYAQLGWVGQEVEETVFFQVGCLGVALWSREKLALDAGVTDTGTDGFGGIVLAHNVRSRAEVDAILDTASRGGAVITKRPQDTFYGGYAGCFSDPDGHLWEVAYNPGFPLADDGSITIPDFGVG